MEELFFVLFGMLIGSFLNVVIIRLPAKKDLVFQRSACPQCNFQLKWYHNIPVLSYIALRGKCSNCHTRISWQYPLIEVLTSLCAYWLMPADLLPHSLMNFVFYFTIACIFICHLVIDLKHHLLLDSLNLYLLALFLVHSVLNYHWKFWVFGGALGFFMPLFVTWLFYKIRGQVGLGGGDIKLYGILGIYIGPLGIIMNIFVSCMLGAVLGLIFIASGKMNKSTPMAFGPAIIIVAIFQIFFPMEAEKFRLLILGY